MNPIHCICTLNCVFLFQFSKLKKRASPGAWGVHCKCSRNCIPQQELRVQVQLCWGALLSPLATWGKRKGRLLPPGQAAEGLRVPCGGGASTEPSIPPVSVQVWPPECGSDRRVRSTNHTPGNPVTAPITNQRATGLSESCCQARLTGFQLEAQTLEVSFLLRSLYQGRCAMYGQRCSVLKPAAPVSTPTWLLNFRFPLKL